MGARARRGSATQASSSQLYEADGALVWIADIWDDTDSNAWSWIGVSEDGGATWAVSAGQPGMQLAGLQSDAASDDAIGLSFTGDLERSPSPAPVGEPAAHQREGEGHRLLPLRVREGQ